MRKAREQDDGAANRGPMSRKGGGEDCALARLGKRFAHFRKEHARGARWPEELKAAALAALRQVPPGDLYRACGVSYRQVMAWKAAAEARREASPDVRVFTVVDDEAVPVLEPAVSTTASKLELRIGPWWVSLRLEGHDSAVRGGACFR